ncbi:MAG: serine/threonine-protein phosphatase [Solobacterium sp.]|nr:serine/threonine-protein phosphatase [Solobacterium sp.]
MKLLSANYTDRGSRDGINQDSVLALTEGDLAIFCVADGMGGHMHGELASREIIGGIRLWQRENKDKEYDKASELFDEIEEILTEANKVIFEKYNSKGPCGSTVVCLVIFKDRYAVFSAGDSRLYKKKKIHMYQITRDDAAPNGKLTKAVGVSDSLKFNRITGKLGKKDEFFLCSDGVYKELTPKTIKKLPGKVFFTGSNKGIEKLISYIQKEVTRKGAGDNHSAIFVKCVG